MAFLKYWPSSRDFNKLVIKAKMHANINFWTFVVWKYDMFFYIFFERLGRMHKNSTFYFYIFIFFLWKPSILIPDLYLYNIKIQTNIDQNAVKQYTRKSQIFLKIFFEFIFIFYFYFWAGSSSALVAGLDPAGLSGSLARPNDPAD